MKKFLLATRPSFLTITLLGCFIGISSQLNEIKWAISIFGTLIALIAHAAANLLNDYHDFLNGTDEINVGRVYPFTGGSRFIQNKEVTPDQIRWLSLLLFLLVICAGIALTILTTSKLIWIGILGIFIILRVLLLFSLKLIIIISGFFINDFIICLLRFIFDL